MTFGHHIILMGKCMQTYAKCNYGQYVASFILLCQNIGITVLYIISRK